MNLVELDQAALERVRSLAARPGLAAPYGLIKVVKVVKVADPKPFIRTCLVCGAPETQHCGC